MLLVGLTGGLASGKSTVARLLAEQGAVVVDADQLARQAVAPGSPGLAAVTREFGTGVLADDGSLDRAALAGIVFGDEERLRTLEGITHPEVFRLLAEVVADHRGTDAVVVFDAPLIFETGFAEACDVVVVVAAGEETRVGRVTRERGLTAEEAAARIGAQLPEDDRRARADILIENEGSLAELERAAAELWIELRRRAAEG